MVGRHIITSVIYRQFMIWFRVRIVVLWELCYTHVFVSVINFTFMVDIFNSILQCCLKKLCLGMLN